MEETEKEESKSSIIHNDNGNSDLFTCNKCFNPAGPRSLQLSTERNSSKLKVRDKEYKKTMRRLEFVHITKTGGSAIESIAAKHGIIWGACHFANNTMVGCHQSHHVPWRDYYIGTAWHAPPKVLNALLPTHSNPYHGAELFVVVRNPYDRAVSEYYCPFFGMEGASKNNDPKVMNQWIQGMIQDLNDQPQNFYYKSPTMPKYPSKKHYLNQVEYIYDLDGTRIVKHVLYYENLSRDFNDLMKEYGLPMRLPNKGKDGVNVSRTKLGEKKFTFRDLDETSIRMINEYAKKDFELLGYKKVVNNNNFFGDGEGKYHLEAELLTHTDE